MAGYFGTENQQRLQKQAEAAAEMIVATPGACQAGRTMGCDDPARLGWDRIESILRRDGVCGFRLIPAEAAAELEVWLAQRSFRFDTWNVFLTDRATALEAAEGLLQRGLPPGTIGAESPTDPVGEHTRRLQSVMNEAGVVPFSGSLLVGAIGRATTPAIVDDRGDILATAHGYLPHNRFSTYQRYAWGGLVAVAKQWRGRGLGNLVNARMIVNACHLLDVTHVYELVSTTNMPSRRMVESCGLRLDPSLVCGVATPVGGAQLTR